MFDLERFAADFHKYPDVVEAQKPNFEIEFQYFGVIYAFTVAHFILKDPVGPWIFWQGAIVQIAPCQKNLRSVEW